MLRPRAGFLEIPRRIKIRRGARTASSAHAPASSARRGLPASTRRFLRADLPGWGALRPEKGEKGVVSSAALSHPLVFADHTLPTALELPKARRRARARDNRYYV